MTLREVFEVLEAAEWRRVQETRGFIITAWNTAAFASAAFAGKLNPLDEYLPDEDGDDAPRELPGKTEELFWKALMASEPPKAE